MFGPGSTRSRRGRASGCLCRSTPGPCSRSRWKGSSKGSRAGLWWSDQAKRSANIITWLINKHTADISKKVSLTIGITYSQLGRILRILHDSDPFDSPQLSFSVFYSTWLKFHVVLRANTSHANITSRLHICTKKITDSTHSISELTTRMELSAFKVKLVSMHRPFSNWAGSLAISYHLPMNCEGKRHTRVQRQFETPSGESMNKSTCFSGFSKMHGRCPVKPILYLPRKNKSIFFSTFSLVQVWLYFSISIVCHFTLILHYISTFNSTTGYFLVSN